MRENEKILPVNIGRMINTISDTILKKYLFQIYITRLINCIAIVSVIVWGMVLMFVY